MVTRHNDDGVICQVEFFDAASDSPDMVINITHGCIVGATSTPDFFEARRALVEPAHHSKSVAMRILCRVGRIGKLWIRYRGFAEPIPVFLWWLIGVMRMDKTCHHQKWRIVATCLVMPYPVSEITQAVEYHFVVEVLLSGGL